MDLADNPTCLKVSFDDRKSEGISLKLTNIQKNLKENENITIQFTDFSYEICLNFNGWEYEILSEIAEFKFNVLKFSGEDFSVISQMNYA